MTTAPKLEPTEQALEEALCNYTNWVEDFGHVTDPDHARAFKALCDAYEAWHRRAAPSAGLREAIEKAQEIVDFNPLHGDWDDEWCEKATDVARTLLTLSKERGEVASRR